VTLSAWGR